MDTFVVRVIPVDETEAAALRGVVSHVASGHSEKFRTVDELVAFLADPHRGTGIGEELPQ
ncbi:MAG TPA: hypothetical protein VIP77_09950 [Jiangellaceae bacterium]